MNRFKASLAHFSISLAIAGVVFLAVRFGWYPGPLFEVAGGLELLVVIVCVDVTLGPLITLIIFRPGKPGLAFDLAVIAIVQACALVYGVFAIAESRPAFITFVKDRFELVRAGELSDDDLARGPAPEFRSNPWFGYRLAGARIPKDPNEQLALLDSAIIGSKDVQFFPRYYVPYAAVAADAAAIAAPLSKLRALNPRHAAEIDAVVSRSGPEERLAFLPMRAGKRDMTVVVARPRGEVVALLPLIPWEY